MPSSRRKTPRNYVGAHLLLVRTRVLNDQLAGDLYRWYGLVSRPQSRHRTPWRSRRSLSHFVPLSQITLRCTSGWLLFGSA
jgi:hypothetical protein